MSMHTAIISGFGGQGVMLMGQLVTYAGMLENKQVTWMPSYGPEMRGGTANCSIVVDDENAVGSPVVDQPSEVVVMNIPSLIKFEGQIVPNGWLIINSSVVDRKPERTDIRMVSVDANAIAEAIGNPKVANMVVLGAYIQATNVVSKDSVVKALEKKLTGKKAQLLDMNCQALDRGMEEARKQM
ncbi:MAG TPA: 2-oxoacid:acceptor oxidoreductase family protein [Thermotogota bacterium]|nr:2-oxoacid:acceptor oxidoreductase family protein [Thermotogota bacterium]HRW92796.1 2-oxoacid:acceptor oxidoreductase family protein [Thermotogota bacterium]